MAVARTESPPLTGGGDSGVARVDRDRPERALLGLRRGGWISPEQVEATQHRFLLEAMTEAAAEVGAGRVTARDVIRRARVSGRTFYELFPDLDACLVAVLQCGRERVLEAAYAGYIAAGDAPWETRVRGSLVEMLTLCEAHPSLARTCLAQDTGGPADVLAAQRALIDGLVGTLIGSAQDCGVRRTVPDRVVRSLIHGALAMVRDELAAPVSEGSLTDLTGELVYAVCGPFLGRAAVTRQLHLPVAGPVRDWSAVGTHVNEHATDPSWEGPREQVLRYVAAHPGASNLMVGAHLDSNESTTSRRLARLARDGLLVAGKCGGRNSWQLTDRGHEAFAALPAPAKHLEAVS